MVICTHYGCLLRCACQPIASWVRTLKTLKFKDKNDVVFFCWKCFCSVYIVHGKSMSAYYLISFYMKSMFSIVPTYLLFEIGQSWFLLALKKILPLFVQYCKASLKSLVVNLKTLVSSECQLICKWLYLWNLNWYFFEVSRIFVLYSACIWEMEIGVAAL